MKSRPSHRPCPEKDRWMSLLQKWGIPPEEAHGLVTRALVVATDAQKLSYEQVFDWIDSRRAFSRQRKAKRARHAVDEMEGNRWPLMGGSDRTGKMILAVLLNKGSAGASIDEIVGKPPVPLPPELHGHLRRWKRRGQRFAVEWLGEPVSSIKKAFRAVAEDAGLGPDVTPHVLRHTAATWLMQAGTDPWEAAGFLGMTVETLMSRYGHHHPDYLSGARGAFSGTVTGTGTQPPNVNKHRRT